MPFAIVDEDVRAHRSLFAIMRAYALAGRADVVMAGPREALAVVSVREGGHDVAAVKAIARERLRAVTACV